MNDLEFVKTMVAKGRRKGEKVVYYNEPQYFTDTWLPKTLCWTENFQNIKGVKIVKNFEHGPKKDSVVIRIN